MCPRADKGIAQGAFGLVRPTTFFARPARISLTRTHGGCECGDGRTCSARETSKVQVCCARSRWRATVGTENFMTAIERLGRRSPSFLLTLGLLLVVLQGLIN